MTSGTIGVLMGIGTLVFALAPLSIPFLVLTAVFLAPLGLVGLLLVPFALVALAVRAVRRLMVRRRAETRLAQADHGQGVGTLAHRL